MIDALMTRRSATRKAKSDENATKAPRLDSERVAPPPGYGRQRVGYNHLTALSRSWFGKRLQERATFNRRIMQRWFLSLEEGNCLILGRNFLTENSPAAVVPFIPALILLFTDPIRPHGLGDHGGSDGGNMPALRKGEPY